MKMMDADFVIIGSGLAGTAAAYFLSHQGNVLLLSKGSPAESNSYAAQGGFSAAIGTDDDVTLHAHDTLEAGAGMCDAEVVTYLTATAPGLVQWMLDIGVPFDRNSTGEISLGLEAAHSRRRILHAGGDATGRKIMETVTAIVENNPTIKRVSNVQVLSLIQDQDKTVIGALGQLDGESGDRIQFHSRRAVILATGGAGQLFQRTTNPAGATGDGIALAYQAGARVRDLEFVQFHPTTLDLEGCPSFLISEAVRGAGGTLMNHLGEAIMADYPQGDLEARDVVARVIYDRLQQGEPVYLDCRTIENFSQSFPTIHERCRSFGIDVTKDLIPVAPAAHFMMGGVVAEINGKTDVPGLYAIGEVASTGVHGANRLASNSLLECLVMAFSLAEHMGTSSVVQERPPAAGTVMWPKPLLPDSLEILSKVREIMWQTAGIVRQEDSLQIGLRKMQALHNRHPQSPAVCTAKLILQSALLRRESRGAHYRNDFPVYSSEVDKADTVLFVTEECATSRRSQELALGRL